MKIGEICNLATLNPKPKTKIRRHLKFV